MSTLVEDMNKEKNNTLSDMVDVVQSMTELELYKYKRLIRNGDYAADTPDMIVGSGMAAIGNFKNKVYSRLEKKK